MNAFNIYDAAFDSAQSEWIPMDRPALIKYVTDYADGAMDVRVSKEVAEAIADAHLSYKGLDEDGGEYEHAFFIKIKNPLSEIEV